MNTEILFAISQKCDCRHCSQRATMAKIFPDEQSLEIKSRHHGTIHTLSLSLGELVMLLDPHGTSYTTVGATA